MANPTNKRRRTMLPTDRRMTMAERPVEPQRQNREKAEQNDDELLHDIIEYIALNELHQGHIGSKNSLSKNIVIKLFDHMITELGFRSGLESAEQLYRVVHRISRKNTQAKIPQEEKLLIFQYWEIAERFGCDIKPPKRISATSAVYLKPILKLFTFFRTILELQDNIKRYVDKMPLQTDNVHIALQNNFDEVLQHVVQHKDIEFVNNQQEKLVSKLESNLDVQRVLSNKLDRQYTDLDLRIRRYANERPDIVEVESEIAELQSQLENAKNIRERIARENEQTELEIEYEMKKCDDTNTRLLALKSEAEDLQTKQLRRNQDLESVKDDLERKRTLEQRNAVLKPQLQSLQKKYIEVEDDVHFRTEEITMLRQSFLNLQNECGVSVNVEKLDTREMTDAIFDIGAKVEDVVDALDALRGERTERENGMYDQQQMIDERRRNIKVCTDDIERMQKRLRSDRSMLEKTRAEYARLKHEYDKSKNDQEESVQKRVVERDHLKKECIKIRRQVSDSMEQLEKYALEMGSYFDRAKEEVFRSVDAGNAQLQLVHEHIRTLVKQMRMDLS
ncbi:hypothetical protein PCE1_001844 [Barthelona sp. PCE]